MRCLCDSGEPGSLVASGLLVWLVVCVLLTSVEATSGLTGAAGAGLASAEVTFDSFSRA